MGDDSDSKMTFALMSDPEIVITRTFDAPRAVVFEAHGKPEYVKRWWRPRHFDMPVCDMDFRTGGVFRFVHRAPSGEEYPLEGEYREVLQPEKIILGLNLGGIACVETLAFSEQNDKTTITSTMVFDSLADRDAIPAADMEAGTAEAFDLLAELLEELV